MKQLAFLLPLLIPVVGLIGIVAYISIGINRDKKREKKDIEKKFI